MIFYGDFRLRDISKWTALKSIEIDKVKDKMHMKFSALIIDFDSPSLDFLRSKKPGDKGIKERCPLKVVILPLLVSLSWKLLQITMGMLSITTSTTDELFNRINIDDSERPWISKWKGFYQFLQSSAAAHTPRMKCDEMAGDRLKICEQFAFTRLVSISSNFLLVSVARLLAQEKNFFTFKFVLTTLKHILYCQLNDLVHQRDING